MINHLPLGGDMWGTGLSIEGRPIPRPGEQASAMAAENYAKVRNTLGAAMVTTVGIRIASSLAREGPERTAM